VAKKGERYSPITSFFVPDLLPLVKGFTHAAGIPQNHTSSRIAEGRSLPDPVSAEEAEVQLQATRKAEHENHLKTAGTCCCGFYLRSQGWCKIMSKRPFSNFTRILKA
jgi:hypothetical protein